ncbi:MAG: ABC transporter ATP-binding protein [Desulfomonilaceae bacterium]|nr:ABC transporter ATP-binding protein [Desulfomonilaceae bacterium]
MVTEKILETRNLVLSFGGVKALNGVDLHVKNEEILAVIGPNGAGKSSLLNCINGFYSAQQGTIHFKGKPIHHLPPHAVARLGISRTFQNIELYTGLTVLENLMAARHIHMKRGAFWGGLFFGPALKEEIRHRVIVEEIIDFLEIEPERHKVVGMLPYGVRKRVELGRALAMDPTLLVLDEPMAGMNLEEKEDMARFILDVSERRRIPMIIVEHDMDVVLDIADRSVVLDFGTKIADGRTEEIVRDPRVVQAYLGEE